MGASLDSYGSGQEISNRVETKYPDGYLVSMTAETRTRLEAAAGAIDERNSAIRQAYSEGAGLREIARIVGMTHAGVRKIVLKDQSQ